MTDWERWKSGIGCPATLSGCITLSMPCPLFNCSPHKETYLLLVCTPLLFVQSRILLAWPGSSGGRGSQWMHLPCCFFIAFWTRRSQSLHLGCCEEAVVEEKDWENPRTSHPSSFEEVISRRRQEGKL